MRNVTASFLFCLLGVNEQQSIVACHKTTLLNICSRGRLCHITVASPHISFCTSFLGFAHVVLRVSVQHEITTSQIWFMLVQREKRKRKKKKKKKKQQQQCSFSIFPNRAIFDAHQVSHRRYELKSRSLKKMS